MARTRTQLQIAGTEALTIEEIDEAAETYRVLRDERMAVQKKEIESRKRVLEAMKKHNLEAYKYEDGDGKQRQVSLTSEVKVKVKRIKGEEDQPESTDEVTEEPTPDVDTELSVS